MRKPDFLEDLESRRPLLEARAAFLHEVRAFFRERAFLEVDPPLLVPAPGMETHLDAFEVAGAATGSRAFLPTSPEFYLKKLIASGVERCFSLGPAFRDEPRGSGHEPEFLMLEWYRAGETHEALIEDCASLLAALGRRFLPGGVLQREGRACDFTGGIEALPLSEAFRRFAGADWLDFAGLEDWRRAARDHGALSAGGWSENDCFSFLMLAAVEPALAAFPLPVVLEGYPAFQAALARRRTGDPRIAERFELFAAGVELANAYTELTDEAEQRLRFVTFQRERTALGKPPHPADEQFLQAVGHLPPCAGIALGADRLLALLLGQPIARVRHGTAI
jgi:lysyl-tRNA synthetase class 2